MISLPNRYNCLTSLWRVAKLGHVALPLYAGRIQQSLPLNLLQQKEVHSFQGLKLKSRINKMLVVIVSSVLIAPLGANTASAANYSVDHLRLYAHSRILNWVEFQCFNKIITKESRWSYRARNGSHYGLGQMRSKYYRDLDPFRQIDYTLRYVTKRYNTPCKAWAFHQERNYY